MRTTITALVISGLMLLHIDQVAQRQMRGNELPSKQAYALRFNSPKELENARLPEGSEILSKHEPYNLLVVTSKSTTEASLEKFKTISGLSHVEETYEDASGSVVIPTGIALYAPKKSNETQCLEFCKNLNCTVIRTLDALGWQVIALPAEMTFENFSSLAKNTDLFDEVMCDEIITAHQDVTNDPYWSTSWHLYQLNDKDIDADVAWTNLPATSTYKSVAVLDGHGFDTAHPDLVGQFSETYNAVDQTTIVDPASSYEKHGTACSGIIAATTNNTLGTSGLGNNLLKVFAIKIGYNANSSGSFSTSSLIQADGINHAMANSTTACISMSFGGSTYQATFLNAITSARTQGRGGKGIAVFASTGNDGSATWANYPASYSGVIAVGSSTSADARSSFSNYGTGLTLAAPGSGVPTTDVSGTNGYSTADYCNFSGTSAACPVAASVGGMMVVANPQITEAQIKQYMAESCEKVGGYVYSSIANYPYSTWSNELGYGRINMNGAVQLALQTTTVSPDISLVNAASNSLTPSVGQIITITSNQTTSLASGSTIFPNLEYRWSTDQIWSSTDVIIGTDASTLGGGITTESESITYTVPAGIGVRYILIKCDSGNSVTESNENNNMAIITVTVSAAAILPDLTVSNLAVDDSSPNVGQNITITCIPTITNASASASDIITEYRYSTDAVWSTNDVVIGTDTSSLNSSVTNSAEFANFIIPSGIGARYILVRTDATGILTESNETNNTFLVTLTVAEVTVIPDIAITQLTTSSLNVSENQPVTILCQQVISNATIAPVTVSIEYRWSTDNNWSANDVLVGSGTSSLSANINSEVETATFNVPLGPGNFYLLVKADAAEVVAESNESNVYSLLFTVTAQTTIPDVFLADVLTTASTVTVGQTITVSCLQNINITSIPSTNVFMEYRWATSSTYSTSFPIVGVDYSSLGAGDPNDPETHTFTIPAGTGQRYILIICDSNNGVSESNEVNNVYVVPITVSPAASVMSNKDNTPVSTETSQPMDYSPDQETVSEIQLFEVYPNPARDFIKIQFPVTSEKSGQYEIRNATGALIQSSIIPGSTGSFSIDLSDFTNGLYFIQVNYNDQNHLQRILVAR